MSAFRYRPRRRLRSDLLPLVSVGAVVFAITGLFPRGLDPFARPGGAAVRAGLPGSPACAFVTLTPEQEDAVLAAARTSWQSDAVLSSKRRIEMLPTELPAIPFSPAAEQAAAVPADAGFRASPKVRTLPPTEAAPAPVRLPRTEAEAPRKAFPRAVMLQLR